MCVCVFRTQAQDPCPDHRQGVYLETVNSLCARGTVASSDAACDLSSVSYYYVTHRLRIGKYGIRIGDILGEYYILRVH